MALLGKLTFIQSYDADDSAFPILGILCDPRAPGYVVPDDLAPHPDTQAWPNHVFHSAAPAGNEGRVMWSYSIFPGPWSTSTRQDYDGETLTTKTRRNIAANVTTQETLVSTLWTRTYRQQQNDDLIATEIQEFRTVPGNYVPTTRYDLVFGPISGTRRLVANSGLTTTLTATFKRTYQAYENSDLVVWELIETNSNGTGSAGNPAYPIRVTDFYDNDRGAVERTSQAVSDITTAGNLVVTGTTPTATATLTRYEPINQFLRDKIVETWTLNGPLLRNGERYDKDLGLVTSTRQLADGTGSPAQSESATGLTKYETSSYGNPVVWKIVESWVTANFPTNTEDIYDGEKGAVEQTSILSTDTNTAGSIGISSNIVTETSWKPRNAFLRYKIIDTWDISAAPSLIRYDVDDETYDQVKITTQLIAKPSAGTISALNVAGTQVNYLPLNDYYGRKVSMEIGATPTSRTETVLSSYTFPALVTGGTISSLTRVDKNAKFLVNLNHIGARSRVVPHTVAITYGTYSNRATAAATLENARLKLKTYDLNFQGVFFNVQASNVLTDSFTIGATTGSDNPTWGVVTETYTVAASSPTATAYITLIGAAQGVSWSLKPWKYNLWRLENVSVVME
jgi:hypothetical protein